MKLNGHEVIDRHNRPPVLGRVLLRTFFVNDGAFVDPYQVSSVHIFKKTQNLTPSTILDNDGLVASGSSQDALMVFSASGNGIVPTPGADGVIAAGNQFAPTNYRPALDANNEEGPCFFVSSIYRTGLGEYSVVLDGLLGASLSGNDDTYKDVIKNTTSATGEYIDVWRVKQVEGSAWKTIIHEFSLNEDTFYNITEPILIKTTNKLVNKHIRSGSKEDLKITTEVLIENRGISQEIKNVFKDSALDSVNIKIFKQNETRSLPSRVLVVDSTTARITSDNTIVYNFDTTNIVPVSPFATADLGSITGTYLVQVTYTLLNQTFVSPLFPLVVS
tara:strand:+ start:2435 stop:3430 length:996 start_codon:yes stop_codon:yes gene_type:complete